MASNEIALYERAIDTALPTIENILKATPGIPALSFKSAMLSQMVRSKAANKLMECSTVSFLNCAATFAGLGLMPDGVTGQAYMIPFGGIATPVIGYKGYNTLGDRAGRTIDGNVVREGDQFDYMEGTDPWIKHKALAAHPDRITHAWAAATAPNRTPLIVVMPIVALEAVRIKSPAGNKSDSPWMDLVTGRPAMYAKTAKRRLARGMPLVHGRAAGYHLADAIEGQFEATGRPHYLLPGDDGRLHVTDGVSGERVDIKPPTNTDPTQPLLFRAKINAAEPPHEYQNVSEWKAALLKIIDLNASKKGALQGIQNGNAQYLEDARADGFKAEADEIASAIDRALKTAK